MHPETEVIVHPECTKPVRHLADFIGSTSQMSRYVTQSDQKKGTPSPEPVVVWDLPTRLFHWLLVLLIIISFVTAKMGGNAMQYHEWSGFAILALLLFRLAWGIVGSRESRFTTFVKSPAAVWRYAAKLVHRDSPRSLGHNPLGGWSILAMLVSLFVQVGTGLFANDDILFQGPLYHWVSKETSNWLTRIHLLNKYVIIVLVVTHICAVLFYLLAKRENLLKPMITGTKEWSGKAETSAGSLWTALGILGIAVIAVYAVIY